MLKKEIFPTALHKIPKEVEKAIESDEELLNKWNAITPLARNEDFY